jgi:FlaA1/EpsC-like NDP-sugar epimerase
LKFERNHLLQVIFDIIAINFAWFFALILRFDGHIPTNYLSYWWGIVLAITLTRITVFYFYRLYQSLWSYSSVPEFFLVVKAVTVSTIIIWAFALSAQGLGWLPFPTPKAIGIIDWLVNVL